MKEEEEEERAGPKAELPLSFSLPDSPEDSDFVAVSLTGDGEGREDGCDITSPLLMVVFVGDLYPCVVVLTVICGLLEVFRPVCTHFGRPKRLKTSQIAYPVHSRVSETFRLGLSRKNG